MQDQAAALIALKSAVRVELSYFPEQVSTETSPYAALMADFNITLKDWDKTATGDEPNAVHIASLPVATLYPGYATGTP